MALSRKPQEIVEGSSNPLLGKHESWGRVLVNEIADILNGYAFKSVKFTRDKGTPLIRIRDVGKSFTKTFFDGEFDDTYLVKDGDLLIGMDGDFRCSIWKGGEALLNQRVCKISLKTDNYNFKFLSYVLQPYLDAIHAETSAVTVKHLSSRSISEIPLPLPPPEQQKRIVAKIEELFSHIDAGIEALKKAKQLLKQYRQSVLKAAVTGELTKDLPSRQAGWREPSFRNISGKKVPLESDKYFAYVLECEDGSFYKGFSKNLFSRINQHLSGQGAKWTKEHKPISIIHFEEFSTEKEAVEREKYFKSGSGREWLNQVKEQQNKKYEPAAQLLERILKERRKKWEEQQLEQFKAKGKIPKDDKWKAKYKEPNVPDSSELPGLPSEWAWSGFEQASSPEKSSMKAGPFGSALKKQFYVEKGYKIYGQEQVINNDPYFGDYYVNEEKYLSLINCAVKPGDFLISLVGTIGRTLVLPDDIEPGIINPRLIKITFDKSACLPEYVQIYVASPAAKQLFKLSSHGGTMDVLNMGTLKALPLPLPPVAEQNAIVGLVKERETAIVRQLAYADNQILLAEKNKQSVLASVFSGKLECF